jgi:hypothetical protein
VIVKALKMIARRLNLELTFEPHELGASMGCATIGPTDPARMLVSAPQYAFRRTVAGWLVQLDAPLVYDLEKGAERRCCSKCGYDRFTVVTVVSRECSIFECSEGPTFDDPGPHSINQHVAKCACCGQGRLYV